MLSLDICKQTSLVSFLTILSLLWSGHTFAARLPSSSLFPLEVFGSQDEQLPLSRHSGQQVISLPDYDHPRYSNASFPGDETGDSPFFYCPESDPDNDLFSISKIVLNPNPPRINYVYVFHAHGYFREAMYRFKGPFIVRASVRNEDHNGLDFTYESEFCDFIDLLEMDGMSTICPALQGYGTIHKIEFVDFGISQGNYSVKIDVTSDNKRLFCVQSWFELSRSMFKESTESNAVLV